MFEKKVGRPTNETVRNRKIFKLSIALIAIVLVGAVIGFAYARYSTAASTVGKASVASWNIQFKNGDNNTISNTNNITFTPSTSANVAANKVAPTSTVSATVKIDPTGSEVAVDYWLSIPRSALNLGGDNSLSIQSIVATTNGASTTLTGSDVTENSELVYKTDSVMIPLSDVTSGDGETSITITLAWDDDSNIASNATETMITVPVTLNAAQHMA